SRRSPAPSARRRVCRPPRARSGRPNRRPDNQRRYATALLFPAHPRRCRPRQPTAPRTTVLSLLSPGGWAARLAPQKQKARRGDPTGLASNPRGGGRGADYLMYLLTSLVISNMSALALPKRTRSF